MLYKICLLLSEIGPLLDEFCVLLNENCLLLNEICLKCHYVFFVIQSAIYTQFWAIEVEFDVEVEFNNICMASYSVAP